MATVMDALQGAGVVLEPWQITPVDLWGPQQTEGEACGIPHLAKNPVPKLASRTRAFAGHRSYGDLSRSWSALRELHPSDHHLVRSAIGGDRRSVDSACLWEDLNLYSFLGIILLIGIVKKNAIMIVDFALDAERDSGLSPEAAVYQGCLQRFRPS
jgi:hypothetical protein